MSLLYTGSAFAVWSEHPPTPQKGGTTVTSREERAPHVAIIMGSKSDWETMRVASETLAQFDVPHECRVISAHRAPDALFEYVAHAAERGIRVIIAGAGGAAHLPGVVAAKTTLPVLGVPMQSKSLQGLDSLLSIVQMPKGIPVGTLAIGEAGAANAALLAVQILALTDAVLHRRVYDYRAAQTAQVLSEQVSPVKSGS
ncbi:MAG: 5-(carboxyamino)imidazole ribonucleotide mutase [Nitrospirae bacterium]|nr:MAG: 5-(carboxyamino)imidazole ribonucleotide mutase [Nitrospirota bacterium]